MIRRNIYGRRIKQQGLDQPDLLHRHTRRMLQLLAGDDSQIEFGRGGASQPSENSANPKTGFDIQDLLLDEAD